MKRLLLFLLLTPLAAQAELPVASIFAASTGAWEGELYYLDYQSNQRFGIPMRVEAETTPDGVTLIRRLTFTDPGVLVHAVNLITVDRDTGELVESYFREGKGQLFRYTIDSVRFDDIENWELVYSEEGVDDDKPAQLRHTLKREGNTLSGSKEVRFLDDDEFFLRNGTELTLQE
jgi:hypothetical protein